MNAWTDALPHLLRPWWLLALPALPALWWLWRRRSRADTPWTRAVDPHLLPNLLQQAEGARGSVAGWLFALAYALAVLALAGPAWRRPVATYALQSPLVVVEDMSSHMLAGDLPPSRLLQARLKVQQLIAQRKGGQMGLVAYAGEAFTVAPLSDDAHSLDDLVVALAPATMPVDGQRADRGLRRAAALLEQAGFPRGTILLLTDDVDDAARKAAHDVHAKGYDVDVIGIGTDKGAPLPAADGTFAQDDAGGLRLARLDADALRGLADAGGGRYAQLTTSNEDLAMLDVLDAASTGTAGRADGEALAWRDGGPFLLLALLPLVALGFRRGWLAVALLAIWSLPAPRVEAKETAAQEQARVVSQRAAAAYRKGDYLAAAKMWSGLDDADSRYNRGDALAQENCFPMALDAWRHALELRPDMKDARANIDLVTPLARRQQQPPKQCGEAAPRQQDARKQDQRQDSGGNDQQEQGQSKNQENMQSSQQQARQQAGQSNQGQQRQDRQASPSRQQAQQQGASQRKDASQSQDAARQQAPDSTKQDRANAAERQALQQALKQQRRDAGAKRGEQVVPESNAQREQREANAVLLRRVPDEPGSLLRRKFALEYERRQQEGTP